MNKKSRAQPTACKLNSWIAKEFHELSPHPCRRRGDSSWTPIGHCQGWVTLKAINMKMSPFMTDRVSFVKVRLQAQSEYKGMLHCMSKTYSREGVRSSAVSAPPPCKNITCPKHNKESDAPSPCFLSSEDSSRAWRSRCWPPASSTRLPSAATATPWITSLSLGAAVAVRASRPPPHRCSLQAASLAWCRWGCSVWGSPSATCGRNEVHSYLDSSGAEKLFFYEWKKKTVVF